MEEKKKQTNRMCRERIVDALVALLQEKPLSVISVSELTERAGVFRMTYYRNYSTKEEILTAYLEELVNAYREDAKDLPPERAYFDRKNLIHCFTCFAKYRDFLDSLIYGGLGHYFLRAINDYIMEQWFRPGDGAERYYTLQAFSGALFQVYLAWSANGAKETPEQLSGILYRIYISE